VVVLIVVLVWRPIQAHFEHDDLYERRPPRFPDARLSAAEMPFARDRVSVRLRRRKAATSAPSVVDGSIGAHSDAACGLRDHTFCRS
jgi:hypothetical protein